MSINRFIDFHSHIIPDVDDGAISMEESIEMCGKYAEYGINTVIATPHYNFRYSGEEHYDKVKSHYNALIKELDNRSIQVNVLLGFELLATKDIIDLAKLQKFTIQNTNALLVEPTRDTDIEWLDELFYTLSVWNITPIVAHPERFDFIQKNFDALELWIKRGVMLQVNLPSFNGKYGRAAQRCAYSILKYGMVGLFGTDAHSSYDLDKVEHIIHKITKRNRGDFPGQLCLENQERILGKDVVKLNESEIVTDDL